MENILVKITEGNRLKILDVLDKANQKVYNTSRIGLETGMSRTYTHIGVSSITGEWVRVAWVGETDKVITLKRLKKLLK